MSDIENGHLRVAGDPADSVPLESDAAGTESTIDTEFAPPPESAAEADSESNSEAASESDAASDPESDAGSDVGSDAGSGPPSGRRSRRGDPESLESEAEIAADYLEELLDIADLDGDIDTYIEGDRAHVSIVSDTDVLVGPEGVVLEALQELARLAVMTETGERSRLMLDVAGYREKRRTELVSLAADAVEEVKSSQAKVPLAPMNPFERKIVHDAVAAAGLTSASEGEEPKRHVVVLPVG